jgi:hypothetical protein
MPWHVDDESGPASTQPHPASSAQISNMLAIRISLLLGEAAGPSP